MVQIESLGKYRFAWGLTWVSVEATAPAKAARQRLDPGSEWLYTGHQSEDGRLAFGYTQRPKDVGKGKLYSYAQALAQVAEPGIYVAPLDGGRIWYTVITQGAVAPDTDAIEPAEAALIQVEGLREAFRLPVLVAHGFEVGIHPDQDFDPGIVLAADLTPLSSLGGVGKAKQLLTLGVLAALVGGMGYWMFGPEEPVAFDNSAAVEAEQTRLNYLAGVQSELATIPRDAGWVAAAARKTFAELPEVYAGWNLREVACLATGCRGIYQPVEDAPFSLSALEASFPEGRVVRGDAGAEVAVLVPLDVAVGLDWGDDMIESGFTHGQHITDVIGSLPTRVPGVSMNSNVQREELHVQLSAPAHFAPLVKEQFSVSGQGRMDPSRVNHAAAAFARAGFAPIGISYTTGVGSTQAGWAMALVRVSGEH